MSTYVATDTELIAKAQELDIHGRTTMTDDELRAAVAEAEGGDAGDGGGEPDDENGSGEGGVVTDGRPDGYAVEATSTSTGEPDSLAKNPLPDDAATGDIVTQVRQGVVDGVTVTDSSDDVGDSKPGDILVSVDPFVTIARGESVQELREKAGSHIKPQTR